MDWAVGSWLKFYAEKVTGSDLGFKKIAILGDVQQTLKWELVAGAYNVEFSKGGWISIGEVDCILEARGVTKLGINTE